MITFPAQSLQAYVLIQAEQKGVDCFRKNEAGLWVLHSYEAEDELWLETVDLILPVEALYRQVHLNQLEIGLILLSCRSLTPSASQGSCYHTRGSSARLWRMFLEELTPVVRTLVQNPIAFAGGFTAGLLKLDLNQDPVKSWLTRAGVAGPSGSEDHSNGNHSGSNHGPQSIEID